MSTSRPRLVLSVPTCVVLILVLGALSGCGLFRSRVVTLCTDRPEMAAYVEVFNALGPELQVMVCYQPDPATSVASRSAAADVVIGGGLTALAVRRQLDPLDRLFGEEGLDREQFYPGLLEAGQLEGRQVTLPLSFGLPAVVFLSGTLGDELSDLSVSLDYLVEAARGFRESVRERYVRIGFSPLWDGGFLYDALRLHGAGFRESADGDVQWESKGLAAGVSFLRAWIEEADGGRGKSAEFSRRYLYEPMRRLLDERRILFYPIDSARLLESLKSQSYDAQFRWLAGPGGILVDESVLSVGIPKSARNKWGARLFVDWLFQESTQRRLLQVNQSKRLSTFGLAGGFSSLRRVSEREFPQVYPLLIGRIPPPALLEFPAPLPLDWQSLRQRAVLAWLRDYLGSDAPADEASRALWAWVLSYREEGPIRR